MVNNNPTRKKNDYKTLFLYFDNNENKLPYKLKNDNQSGEPKGIVNCKCRFFKIPF